MSAFLGNNKNNSEKGNVNPLILLVLDGLGVAPPGKGNPVTAANTPVLDKLWPNYPHTYLQAAGTNVGLPHNTDGNSEVGHINLGAGKIVYQDLPRIDNAINDGSFYENSLFLRAIEKTKQNGSTLHLMGLVGSGEVHSSLSHLFAIVKMLDEHDVDSEKVLIHAFLDGRDSPPKSAGEILDQIEAELVRHKVGRIASVIGRYYAMDRDERWDRTQKAYELITQAQGKKVPSWHEALKDNYSKEKSDELAEAYAIPDQSGNLHKVEAHDSIVFFNFRGDRAVQLTRAFEQQDFSGFSRLRIPDVLFVGMTDYEDGFPEKIAFPPQEVDNPIGKVIADQGLRQLRIAESEKFPHVTYFFNGGREDIFKGEERVEVPSPKDVSTYDQKPEMSAHLVTDILVNKIKSKNYEFIIANYANADMVAHTGNFDATVKAIEIVDESLGRVYEACKEAGYIMVITADHGNAEELQDLRTGEIDTKHSINPVPCMFIKEGLEMKELAVGVLADVAPTILRLMGIEIPVDMEGRNLLE